MHVCLFTCVLPIVAAALIFHPTHSDSHMTCVCGVYILCVRGACHMKMLLIIAVAFHPTHVTNGGWKEEEEESHFINLKR